MKILLSDYSIIRDCTNPSCHNYRSGSTLNGRPELIEASALFGEPEPCSRCGTGCLTVKRASFKIVRGKKSETTSQKFRFLVKCEKCNISWTIIRIAPIHFADIGILEFLKSSSVDELKCRNCKSNADMVLLQASTLEDSSAMC